MSERHTFFLGDPEMDPDSHLLRSNLSFIEQHVHGNYRVKCEHCGVVICGLIVDAGPVSEISWRHDGDNWFGTFMFHYQRNPKHDG